MKICRAFLAFLAGSATSNALNEDYTDHGRNTATGPLVSNETTRYTNHLIDEWNSTGLALAVIQRDGTVTDPGHPGWKVEFRSYGFAYRNSTSTKPMSPDTLFSIASNSKLFLAISVGLLIHNKTVADDFKARHGVELGWKTRMRDLLGEGWEMQDGDATKGATIADLLGHRTGLPRHDYMRVWRDGGIREQIQKLRYLRPSAGFRETVQYNNQMYETLAYLPELLLNQTYESYVAEHLFDPLNMTSTTFSVPDIDLYPSSASNSSRPGRFAHRMAVGYIASNRDLTIGRLGSLQPIIPFFSRPGEERTRAGAGGVISTARDLATWNAMLLSDGAHPFIPNLTIVPKPVLDWITTGRSVFAGVPRYPDTSPMVYGAAQLRYGYRGLDVIEHDGDNPGFKSVVSRYPEKGLGVVALSNDGDNGGWVMNAAKWAVVDDIVFGEREGRVDWTERFHNAVEARRRAERDKVTPRPQHPEPPTRSFKELGQKRFEHPAYGEIVLCRVPPWLLRDPYCSSDPPALSLSRHEASSLGGVQHLLSLTSGNSTVEGHSDYDNPHANCTHLVSSPSVRHILSSTPRTTPAPFPSVHDPADSTRPETFIASFPHSFASHLRLIHFSGDVFNIRVIWANDDVRNKLGVLADHTPLDDVGEPRRKFTSTDQDPGAVLINLDETFTAEWVQAASDSTRGDEGASEGGLSIRDGFWGMQGPDSREPVGVGRQRAEVWFEVK